MDKVTVTFSLPQETIDQINKIKAKKKGMTKSGIIEYAIDEIYKKEVKWYVKVDNWLYFLCREKTTRF